MAIDTTTAEHLHNIREIERDLEEQGIAVYPATMNGRRARQLWRRLRRRLLRWQAVEITASSLGLDWHREQLKRARQVLLDIGLIQPVGNGTYVLARRGPLDAMDDEIRDMHFLLACAVELVGTLRRFA